jgi:hypothetical protein
MSNNRMNLTGISLRSIPAGYPIVRTGGSHAPAVDGTRFRYLAAHYYDHTLSFFEKVGQSQDGFYDPPTPVQIARLRHQRAVDLAWTRHLSFADSLRQCRAETRRGCIVTRQVFESRSNVRINCVTYLFVTESLPLRGAKVLSLPKGVLLANG